MKLINLTDFRGGYFTDTPSELMRENELLMAENCQWKDGIVKRNGITTYSTSDWSGFTGLKGMVRAYINGAWNTIVALDDGSDVNFYYGSGTTFTAIDNDFDWTTGINVEFAVLRGKIVAVNGTDKPAVIYYDSGWVIENLEEYDIRTRDDNNWKAGQWDDSETDPFVDDTTDAQDAGTDDFQVANTTNNDGFYVACDLTFNKLVIEGCQQLSGSPVSQVAYWNGTAWTTLSLITSPSWGDAEADRTIEWNIPLDTDTGECLMEPYLVDGADEDVYGKYVVRVRFTTAPSGAGSCDGISVYHSQYLTQVLAGTIPHLAAAHLDQLFLAENNNVFMSEPGKVTGWELNYSEYFVSGGEKIMALHSLQNALVVFKEKTIYTLHTGDINPYRSQPLTNVGTIATRSVAPAGKYLGFVAIDGIYIFNGAEAEKVSKHIQSDIDGYTLTNSAAVGYKNEYYVSFPTDGETLNFDADTLRTNSMGDGVVSFYKFTGYKSHVFLFCNGDGDNGFLFAGVDQSTPYIARCDNGATDNLSSETAIGMTIQTKYLSPRSFQEITYFGRLKPKIKQVSASAGSTHTLTLLGEDGTVTDDISLTVSVGSGYYSEDISIPYQLDGKNISFKLSHDRLTAAGLIGYAISTNKRRY